MILSSVEQRTGTSVEAIVYLTQSWLELAVTAPLQVESTVGSSRSNGQSLYFVVTIKIAPKLTDQPVYE